jgi:hypothetical protein
MYIHILQWNKASEYEKRSEYCDHDRTRADMVSEWEQLKQQDRRSNHIPILMEKNNEPISDSVFMAPN